MILERLLAWLFPLPTPTPPAGHVCPERAGERVAFSAAQCLLCGAAGRETARRNCVPEFNLCGKEFYYDVTMPAGYTKPVSGPWRCGKFAGHADACLSEDACRLTPTQLGTHRPWAEVGDRHAAMTPGVVAKVQAEAGRADAAEFEAVGRVDNEALRLARELAWQGWDAVNKLRDELWYARRDASAFGDAWMETWLSLPDDLRPQWNHEPMQLAGAVVKLRERCERAARKRKPPKRRQPTRRAKGGRK